VKDKGREGDMHTHPNIQTKNKQTNKQTNAHTHTHLLTATRITADGRIHVRLQSLQVKLENIGSRIDMQTHAGNGRR